MNKDLEQQKQKEKGLFISTYQDDIWAFAHNQAFTQYHEILSRIADLFTKPWMISDRNG